MPRIVVVDDDPLLRVSLSSALTKQGHDVQMVATGDDALSQILAHPPDLVVLDVKLPGMNGFDVLKRLRGERRTEGLLVVMLTGRDEEQRAFEEHVDDFVLKDRGLGALVARIEALIRRRTQPYRLDHGTTITIGCEPGQRVLISAMGNVDFTVRSPGTFDVDALDLVRRAEQMLRFPEWREEAKSIGRQLYTALFARHPNVLAQFQLAASFPSKPPVHVRFRTTREHVRVPFELIWNENGRPGPDYLAQTHAISRSIESISTSTRPISPEFLNECAQKRTAVRMLLVASDTHPAIPGVDKEVEALAGLLPSIFKARGIDLHLDTMPTSRASLPAVVERLRDCDYDILHYAGHGTHVPDKPGDSFLPFYSDLDRAGKVDRLSAGRIQDLVRDSRLRFVFLSCCYGTAAAPPMALLGDDFLGLGDAIAHGGIPTVLGYRRPIHDKSAADFSTAFYSALARSGDVPGAVLAARRAMPRDAARRRDLGVVDPDPSGLTAPTRLPAIRSRPTASSRAPRRRGARGPSSSVPCRQA